MQFRKDIQGLRAIAFLMVFIFHLNASYLPGGFLGVDLFFVISGYLITTILVKSIEENKFRFLDFYIKRFKRIAPAYWVMVSIVTLIGTFILLEVDAKSFRSTVIRSFPFISNLQFQKGESYFGVQLSENPLLHTWSLAIEMQFYFILPLILFYIRKWRILIFSVLIIGISIYTSYQIEFLDEKSIAYFSLLSRIPEFLIGSVFAIKFTNGIDWGRQKNSFFALCNLIILIASCWFITEDSSFPGLLAIIPCVASANLLVIKNNFLSDALSTKIPFFIGELSYSLYLWHWPIMAFIRYRNEDYQFNALEVFIISILTFLTAYLSFRFIELPAKKLSNKKLTLRLVPISFVCFLFGFFLIYPIMGSRKISEYYAKPIIGVDSHYKGIVEKFGDLQQNDSILLMGDSHALMLKPFLDYIGKNNHFSFVTLTAPGYPAIANIDENEIDPDKLPFFLSGQKLVPKTDSLVQKSSLILINSRGFERYPSLKTALEQFIQNLRKDQNLVLILSFPEINEHPLRLSNSIKKKSTRQINLIQNSKNREILEEMSSKYQNVYLYDLTKSKIFNDPGYINDTVSYYDKAHLNTYGSMKLAEDLEKEFMAFCLENKLF